LFERVIASGNHLLTQVKGNQPRLRRRLELGAAGRKPSGFAKSETKGRNRWETRELTVFPAKAWFRHTPWEPFIKTVMRLQRTVCRRDPATGLCRQTSEVVFWVSSAHGPMPEQWNEWIRGHWRIENGSHYVRDMAFAEDARASARTPTSSRASAPLPIISYAPMAAITSKMPEGAPPSTWRPSSKPLDFKRTEQP
jgi:hypothetical protein